MAKTDKIDKKRKSDGMNRDQTSLPRTLGLYPYDGLVDLNSEAVAYVKWKYPNRPQDKPQFLHS